MSERNWTPAQRQSFTARGGSLLVSAAAGSGKTAVLVERVIRRITDPVNPVSVDRLLIVTFTRAAAAEMRQRLSDALAEKMAAEPENMLYARQQMLLPRAYISTIHGFCARLLKEFGSHTDLPVGFRVAEEGQTALLETEALDRVLEQNYRQRDPAFLALATQLCNNKNDWGLRETVQEVYRFMQAQPFPQRWLQQQMNAYTAVTPLEQTPWMEPVRREADRVLERVIHYVDSASAIATAVEIPPYLDAVLQDAKAFRLLRERLPDLSYGELQASLSGLCLTALGRVSKPDAVQKEGMEQVKELRKLAKKRLDKLQALLPHTESECRADLAAMAPLVDALCRLVRQYDATFTELKRRQKWLDYNDLEHQCLRLLVDAETGRPTPLAREISRRFTEIMVDEYQDTNAAQDALFTAVSRDGTNLFMVGDIKQSIYGFRQAMPEIFTDRRDAYNPYDEGAEQFPATITLGNNFRSRRGVTDTVNYLFQQMMTRQWGGVDYDERERLECSAVYPEGDPVTEWMLLDKEDAVGITEVQAEARQIAARIHRLMGEMTVSDKGEQRPLCYRDICILMRKRNAMSVFTKELTRLGIPVAADNSEDFFATPEVSVVLSLLRVIDNPLREVELTAVMLSPLYGFTPDDLAAIKVQAGRYTPLYAAVEQVAADSTDPRLAGRLTAFLADLRRFRTLAVTLPADRLLETVYRDTAIEAVYSARSGGNQRVANLQQLDRIVRGYEQGDYRGLSAFVRYLDRMEESGKTLSGGNTLRQEGVRLMTVHGSKGLEFPVVFAARLCGQRSHKDAAKRVLLHATAGIGMKLVDEEENEQHNPLPHTGVMLARQQDEQAEELRIWYVALTRAREKLILVHSAKEPEKLLEKLEWELSDREQLWSDTVISARCPGDALLAAALRHPDFRPLRVAPRAPVLADATPWQIHLRPPLDEETLLEELRPAAEVDETLAATLRQRRDYRYPYADLFGVPAKLAASQLSHQKMSRDHIGVSRPAFLQSEGLTPAQKGTAMHTFMQYADYARAAVDVTAEAERMAQAGFLTRQQADSLNTDRLTAFFGGDLYRRMAAAQQVWREYDFAVTVSAGTLTDLPDAVASEQVLVQGIADCVFAEKDGLVLVDYKTDKVTSAAQLADRYRSQLTFYKQALENILARPVKEMLLYSFHLEEVVAVTE